MTENRIIGITGGLYTVETHSGDVLAKSRGVFRKNGIKPVTGDYVDILFEDNAEPVITEVLDRKNEIVRPPLANVDIAVLVVSAYSGIGYKTFLVDNIGGTGYEPLAEYLKGKTSALIGNTGVGKSSLMNRIAPVTEHKTSEISKKLGRGRHTTREVKLYRPDENTYIADTPGFSTVEISRYGGIAAEELAGCFREFGEFAERCRYKDCAHIKEGCCGVREAVEAGKIASSRHESYCRIYEEIKK